MTTSAHESLQTLRGTDFKHWLTTFWLVKRKLSQKQAKYSVLKVDTDAKLEQKLKQAQLDVTACTEHAHELRRRYKL